MAGSLGCRSRMTTFLETDTSLQDGDGILDSLLPVSEIEICVLFREVDGYGCRITFRSKGRHDVGSIATQLGGGGRPTAAGVFLPIGSREAEEMVLPILRQSLQAPGWAPAHRDARFGSRRPTSAQHSSPSPAAASGRAPLPAVSGVTALRIFDRGKVPRWIRRLPRAAPGSAPWSQAALAQCSRTGARVPRTVPELPKGCNMAKEDRSQGRRQGKMRTRSGRRSYISRSRWSSAPSHRLYNPEVPGRQELGGLRDLQQPERARTQLHPRCDACRLSRSSRPG